jgi:hypothetical protein
MLSISQEKMVVPLTFAFARIGGSSFEIIKSDDIKSGLINRIAIFELLIAFNRFLPSGSHLI